MTTKYEMNMNQQCNNKSYKLKKKYFDKKI